MSAMKMEFICRDSPELTPTSVTNGRLSALLNPPTSLEESEEAMDKQSHPLSSQEPPNKKRKTEEEERMIEGEDPSIGIDGDVNGLSDNENSEDEQIDHAPWEEVDMNPAVELLNKVVRECLEAGKTYNKSITAKSSQLIATCDTVLLELKNLTDAREASRKQGSTQGSSTSTSAATVEGDCACSIALGMFPLSGNNTKSESNVVPSPSEAAGKRGNGTKSSPKVDHVAEDMTDRVLCKIEASMERLRELAELIQATSMQGEANLIAKVTLPEGAITTVHQAIQASAAAATAASIAQERGRRTSTPLGSGTNTNRLYTPLQLKKLQEWYYSYPRPLTDELTLMRTILNYKPFANPFLVSGLTIAHLRDWFKSRRYRERIRFLKLAMESGRDPVAAEEEIDLRIEQRVDHLRVTVDPNELVKELDKVRSESTMYDSMISSFARSEALDGFVSASHLLPSVADQIAGVRNSKRPRTQESEVDKAIVVKVGTLAEMNVLQRRIRSLLTLRSATNTNALQQVMDILRSMEISPELRIQSGIVNDLKQILKVYRKPTLIRRSTIALLESLGMSRRVIIEEKTSVLTKEGGNTGANVGSTGAGVERSEKVNNHTAKTVVNGASGTNSALATVTTDVSKKSSGKKEKSRTKRPMKFSMKQVMALEGWFQKKYKPSPSEMEEILTRLNTPPLCDEKNPMDVSMTQLRRWFNKRRCLRRPPFALMTQQEVVKGESKSVKAGDGEEEDDLRDLDGDEEEEEDDEDDGSEKAAGVNARASPMNSSDESSDDDDSSDDEE